MDFLAFLITQCLNALSQAALLFFLGVGLTLIFGIMRIVNFAHGAFFMLGAYVGYSAVHLTGSFWGALLLAPLAVGGVGWVFELGILRQLYGRDGNAFLMVTFGFTLVLGEFIRLTWGVAALNVPLPTALSGIVFILDEPFPVYRLFLAGAGIVVALAIWQYLERTRLGLLIRATSQNAEMVHALGTDVRLIRSAVFGIGCGLAGIGGVLAAPLVTASLGMAPNAVIDTFVIVIIGGMGSFLGSAIAAVLVGFVQVFGIGCGLAGIGGVLAAPLVTASLGMAPNAVIDTFVIVIIGGMGSFLGSAIAAVLVGFVQVFGTYYFPDLALALMYLLMLLVLVVRPGGLLGKEA